MLPTKFDYWINAEAAVFWYQMEDATAIPASIIEERNDMREIALNSIMSNFDMVSRSEPHFGGGVSGN